MASSIDHWWCSQSHPHGAGLLSTARASEGWGSASCDGDSPVVQTFLLERADVDSAAFGGTGAPEGDKSVARIFPYHPHPLLRLAGPRLRDYPLERCRSCSAILDAPSDSRRTTGRVVGDIPTQSRGAGSGTFVPGE